MFVGRLRRSRARFPLVNRKTFAHIGIFCRGRNRSRRESVRRNFAIWRNGTHRRNAHPKPRSRDTLRRTNARVAHRHQFADDARRNRFFYRFIAFDDFGLRFVGRKRNQRQCFADSFDGHQARGF